MCLRFNAWASRPMWDVDIHVPLEALDKVCQVFAEFGRPPSATIWLGILTGGEREM